jgi:SDR family mycofactocin-dependent oxidoreductase
MTDSELEFSGKVVFVNGAARGQGRSHALRFAAEGADLILSDWDRSQGIETVSYELPGLEDLEQTAEQVRDLGRRAVVCPADVRDLDALTAAAARGIDELGRIDVLVANAGICTFGPLVSMSATVWQEMIDINLTGVFNVTRAIVPHIVAGDRGGRVIATASMAGRAGWENIGHYAAAKWGIIGMIKSLALELAPHMITANVICPSSVNTTMMNNDASYRLFRPDLEAPTREDALPAFASVNVIPAPYAEPDDISDAVLFLASDEAWAITGATLSVAMGVNARNI